MKVKEKIRKFYENSLETIKRKWSSEVNKVESKYFVNKEEEKLFQELLTGTKTSLKYFITPILDYKNLNKFFSNFDDSGSFKRGFMAIGLPLFTTIVIESCNRYQDQTIEVGDHSYEILHNASKELETKALSRVFQLTTPLGNLILNNYSEDVTIIPIELSSLNQNLYAKGNIIEKNFDGFSLVDDLETRTFYEGTHNINKSPIPFFKTKIILSDDEIKQGLEKTVEKLNYARDLERQDMSRQKNRYRHQGQSN
jgi:hypothetical protein